MEDIYRKVAAHLRHHRLRLGLTQEELAERSNVHYAFLGQIERGVKKPSLVTVSRLAKGLGVRTCDLLDEPIPPGKPGWSEKIEALLRDRSEREQQVLYTTLRAMAKGLSGKKS